MRKLFLGTFFIFWGSLFCLYGDSVTLLNDSPFELTATVLAADGTFLGQEVFHPGDQINWDTQHTSTQLDIPMDSSVSVTPYTVVWKCNYKGFYSMCMNVPAGGFVSANNCEGPHYCEPKPKPQKKNGEEEDTSCRECIRFDHN